MHGILHGRNCIALLAVYGAISVVFRYAPLGREALGMMPALRGAVVAGCGVDFLPVAIDGDLSFINFNEYSA